VLGQVAVHIASLIYIRSEAIAFSEELDEEFDLDAEFKPNLLNSAIYLVSLIMQISTFAINYQVRKTEYRLLLLFLFLFLLYVLKI